MICPQCGYEQTNNDRKFINTEECPKCGIFYKKWHPSAPISNVSIIKTSDTSHARKENKTNLFLLLILISILGLASYAGPKLLNLLLIKAHHPFLQLIEENMSISGSFISGSLITVFFVLTGIIAGLKRPSERIWLWGLSGIFLLPFYRVKAELVIDPISFLYFPFDMLLYPVYALLIMYGSVLGREMSRKSLQNTSLKPCHVRPWVRFWARMLDIYVFNLGVGIILWFIAPQFLKDKISVCWVLFFAWIFVEAIMLSSFHTTPGKWLFKIKLTPTSEGQISFSQALSRSVQVWWLGLGTGLPIVSLITLINAYVNFTSKGITSWDRRVNFTVSYEEIGVLRSLAAVLFFIVSFSIIIFKENIRF